MATATVQRPLVRTGNWTSVFPNEQVTEQQSALFVKRLLAVSISNITYLRAIFPEHAFGDRCIEDLNLKILRNDSRCPGACQVIQWMKGCFDALDKKYLKMLVIGIYVDPINPETVIESYTFKFNYCNEAGVDIYRNDKKISSAHTETETRKATIRLLRTIVILTQTLESLPDDVLMTMKLHYYDECTPSDYEPPGFKPCDSESFKFDEEPLTIIVGDISTLFHAVKLRIKTGGKQLETKEDPIENENEEKKEISNNGLDEDMDITDNPIVENNVNIEEVTEKTSMENHLEDEETGSKIPNESPDKPVKGKDLEPATNDAHIEPSESSVRCPCGGNEKDGYMIRCSACKFWQHGICFCIINAREAPKDHICDVCAKPGEDGRLPTEPQFCEMTSIAVQETCLWRKALMVCLESSRVLAPRMAGRLGIEVTIAQGLINRLVKEGFVYNQGRGKRLGNMVNKDKIKTDGYLKYLTKNKIETKDGENNKRTGKRKDKIETKDGENNKRTGKRKDKKSRNKIEKTENIEESNGKKSRNKIEKTENIEESNGKISTLVKQTEGITLSEKRRSGRKKNNDDANRQLKDVNSRGTKRAFSKVDPTKEFELSDSQDFQEPSKTRKRKTSIVKESILV